VELKSLRITFPLQTFQCAFTGSVILERSHLRALSLQATHIKDLAAGGLNVEEGLSMNDGETVKQPGLCDSAELGVPSPKHIIKFVIEYLGSDLQE
jgi:hypothetical protein